MRRTIRYIVLCGILLAGIFGFCGCGGKAEEETELSPVEADADADVSETEPEKAASDVEGTDAAADEKTAADEIAAAGAGSGEETGSDGEAGTFAYVDVCGQVKNPGVYELPSGSRIFEAIEMAGGLTEKAAADSLNKAEKITDGQQIYVPSEKEVREGITASSASETGGAQAQGSAQTPAGAQAPAGAQVPADAQDGKVNLNTASREELMTLNGIGEAKADAIISYREENGGFRSIEDIKKISGIKDGVFNKVKDRITV